MDELEEKMHDIKIKRRYFSGKKKEDTFNKYKEQRRHMRKGKTKAMEKSEEKRKKELFPQKRVTDFKN